MVVLGTPERSPGIGMRIDVDHSDRFGRRGQRPEDRVRHRVITTGGERDGSGLHHSTDKRLDVAVRRGDVEDLREADITDVGNSGEVVRVDACGMVHRSVDRRLVADLTWPVTGARAIGDPAVVWNAVHGDVDTGQIGNVRRPHEGGDLLVTGLESRVACLGHVCLHDVDAVRITMRLRARPGCGADRRRP